MNKTAINRQRGFTLIEIMLVVVIIGVMLAVVVPRAWRANVDAKYGTLRQVCAELAGYANDWAKQQLESQAPTDTAVLNSYFASLTGSTADNRWIAASGDVNNWHNSVASVTGRSSGNVGAVVSDLLPPGQGLRNPFNGLDVFEVGNVPSTTAIPGAIACGVAQDPPSGDYNYYALIFQGTGNTVATDFHAGMGSTLAGLRNGVFIVRVRQ